MVAIADITPRVKQGPPDFCGVSSAPLFDGTVDGHRGRAAVVCSSIKCRPLVGRGRSGLSTRRQNSFMTA